MKDYNDNSITMTSSGIVYKLHHDDSKHVYVGSTMLEPKIRLSSHRAKLKSGIGAIAKYFNDCVSTGLQLSIITIYTMCDHKHILAYEQLHINREKAINANKSFKVANLEYKAKLKKKI
jgi:predicted GIY-YIG superfamily endonuclease